MTRGFVNKLQLILVQSGPELTQLSRTLPLQEREGGNWYRFCFEFSLSHHSDYCFITSQKSSTKRL